MRGRTDTRAVAALSFLTLAWGYNWVVMKVALQDAGPFDFAALRTVFGATALFLTLAVMRLPMRPPPLTATLVLGLLQTTGFLGLAAWAVSQGPAGRSAVLAFTMPFWVLIFAGVFLHERIRGLQWLAVASAAVGLSIIFAAGSGPADLPSASAAVAAGACWGLSVVVAKRMAIPVRELGALTAWQMAIGGVPLVLLALWVPEPPVVWSTSFIAALAYNVVPANALAWLLWLYVLGRLSAGITGLSALAVPVVGALAAAVQLGEIPSPLQGLGMALILAALALLSAHALTRDRTLP